MFIKLQWTRKSDKFQSGVVIGDPESIRDLYWQLSHNYNAQDGTEIGELSVTNLDGYPMANVMCDPFESPHWKQISWWVKHNMNKIYSEENQKIIDNLQQIIYNYDEEFITIAKTFIPEREINSRLLLDVHRNKMLEILHDVMIYLPFTYETKLN